MYDKGGELPELSVNGARVSMAWFSVMLLLTCVNEYSCDVRYVARPDLLEPPVSVDALLEVRGLELAMQRRKVSVMVISKLLVRI